VGRPPVAELTPTELRCLRAASYGLRADETAEALGLTFDAVRMQLRHARRKLAAKNTAHALAIAMRHGLIS
jgi:DNA-binding CsgD family transcriptional regulator